MPLRTFIDQNGVKWDVWLVQPSSRDRRGTERRILAERRKSFRFGDHIRRMIDRRKNRAPWLFLREGYERGWLAFQSEGERRRLGPPPENWEKASREELDAYSRMATPVVK